MSKPANGSIEALVSQILSEEQKRLAAWLRAQGADSTKHRLASYHEDFRTTHMLMPIDAPEMPVEEAKAQYPYLVIDYGNREWNDQMQWFRMT